MKSIIASARKYFRSGRMHIQTRAIAGLVVAILVMSCSDDPISAPEPQVGNLVVAITTTGGDPDDDGYQLVVGSERRHRVDRPGVTVQLAGVKAGTHVLTLEGVADNCSVAGTHPLSITVPSAGTAVAAFAVVCEATGIEIAAQSTGIDYPPAFAVRLGTSASYVNANGSARVTRLSPGSHTVALVLPVNCNAVGGNSASITVSQRAVTRVAFDVTCVRTDKHLAFVDTFLTLDWIFVADENGAQILPLVQGRSPAWSPDGTRLLFSNKICYLDSYYGDSCSGGLASIDPDTRTVTALENGKGGEEPSWSPDGKFIAFTRTENGGVTLHFAGLNGSAAVQLSDPNIRFPQHPSWSSDSKRIVFGCEIAAGLNEICAINRDGTGFARLTSDNALDDSPAWSPDGKRIAFATNRFTGQEIALMTPVGTDITQLTSGGSPAWSADGSKLIFVRRDGLFTIAADGSNLRRLTTGAHRAPALRP
ncbi:MAG: PD40 domain-containing protein [Gemmatimonadaceae bacterium]|nr:PD40 domain-containing protein [Gemmatimonadaceae bacterium]